MVLPALPSQELVFGFGFIVVILVAILFLNRRSRSTESSIDIDDLLLKTGSDGKKVIDKTAVLVFGSFLITSWVIFFDTIKGTLSDTTFSAYTAVWVVPLVAAMFKPQQGTNVEIRSADKVVTAAATSPQGITINNG